MNDLDEKTMDVGIENADKANLRTNIISITPSGQDPVIYWHQVSIDAIDAAERLKTKLKISEEQLKSARSDLELFSKRLIDQTARQRSQLPLDLTNLFRMARDGDVCVNINISVSGGTDHNGKEDGYCED